MEKIRTHSLSFKGRRESNQDNYLSISVNSKTNFIAVADGMGGVAGGNVASKKVLECCEEIVHIQILENNRDLKQILRKIYFEVQNTIRNEVKKDPLLAGMGTTLTCLLIQEDKFVWGNLGDSRIYYLSNGKLKLITKDHSQIQEFIDKNEGKVSQSILDKYSNYLTRSIDGGDDEADIYPANANYLKIKNGDALLLCSDGLIINKSEQYESLFEKFLIGTKNIESAVDNLVNWAYNKGSSDNITVTIVEKGNIKRKIIKELEEIIIADSQAPSTTKIVSSKIRIPLLFGVASILTFLILLVLIKQNILNISGGQKYKVNTIQSITPIPPDTNVKNNLVNDDSTKLGSNQATNQEEKNNNRDTIIIDALKNQKINKSIKR